MTFKTIYTNHLDNGLAICVQEYRVSREGARGVQLREGDIERVLTLYEGRREIAHTHPRPSRFFLPGYMIELACLIQSREEFFDIREQLGNITSREQADGIKSALRTRLVDLLPIQEQ
ncbi:hypothetical protein HYT52_04545 [Candidatus Woesearchaeota archaeon]|nr:hypothetical protein [Candidatus Woesearchaeota archaeon]